MAKRLTREMADDAADKLAEIAFDKKIKKAKEEMTEKILTKLIQQLREQLGEDAYEEEVEERLSIVDKKEKEFEQLPTEDRYVALLDAIDAELKKPNISMEEIDELLDKRRKIQDTISKQLHS